MHLTDLMRTPVVTVTPDTTLGQAAALMLKHRIGCLVVVDTSDPGVPVGIVTETDFDLQNEEVPGVGYPWFKLPILFGTTVWSEQGFEEVYERARQLPVSEVMTSPCLTIDVEEEPMKAAKEMVRHDCRHLPVLRDGRLVGIVTGLDFLVLLADELPAEDADDSAAG